MNIYIKCAMCLPTQPCSQKFKDPRPEDFCRFISFIATAAQQHQAEPSKLIGTQTHTSKIAYSAGKQSLFTI